MPPAASSSRCWIQRDFLKEKLRVKERYWHPIENGDAKKERSLQDNDDHAASPRDLPRRWIIPDALAWRKYLSLILYLMEREHQQEKPPSTRWILLESVAEWMDYRNMSTNMIDKDNNNTIQSFPEKAAPQERLKLQKLMQQRPTRYQTIFDIFCDLSFREGDDEWEPMNYEDMTTVKRSQNALFRAARLLQQYHSQGSAPEIWILSGDIDFVQRFPEEDGIRTILVTDMLERDWFRHDDDEGSLFHLAEHAKRLATRCEEEYASRNKAATATSDSETDDTYTGVQDYWTEDAIQQGLHNKTLVKGRLSVTKENPKEGAVQSGDSSYFINQQHRGYFNRALHHDVVVVQPLPKHLWTSPVGKRRLVPIRNDDNDILDDEGVAAEDDDGNPPIPSGRVVAIVQESRRQFVATMVNTPMNDESACLVVPMDVRIPKIRIKTSGWQRFVGNRLLVQVDSWDVDSTFPSGHCVDILGPIADLETEIACLLKENQIYLEPFSAAAMADLPLEGHDWKIPDVEIAARRDLRSMRIFSVDPNGCQDIDDTMHARVLPTGDIEIGVHIADVTYFVPHNSALDKEAQVRGTTFYLVDRRFDMLPSVLSSDLCSLHGNMDRLAVSTIWTFSGDFETVKDFWYGRSVIHNVQAMTYEQAHNILHDLPPDDPSKPSPPPLTAGYPVAKSNIGPLKEDLATLTKLARFLRKDREDVGGAVDLSSGDQGNELKFLLDSNGSPVRVTPKKQMEVHHTIAELMILANTYVARTIYDSFPESALLRIHQSVDESRFEDLKEVLQAGNICFDGSSNMRLAGSLKVAETKTNSAVSSLFQSLATRCV
jgi:exoribonuclease R